MIQGVCIEKLQKLQSVYNFGFNFFFFPFFKVEKGYIVYYKLTKYEVEANTSPPKNPNNPPKNGIHNAMNPVMAVIKFTI